MVSLEQVKLLESRVTKAIDYIKKVTEEKTILSDKLDSYQKRIDELEILIQRFKEDQNRIEDGILSALDRLNQFEDALESAVPTGTELSGGGTASTESAPSTEDPAQAAETNEPEEKNPLPEHGELDIF